MFNPFEEKPITLSDTMMDWRAVYPKPYDKHTADPYTKVRVILMNGIEVESAMFSHQFHRNCSNNDIRRNLLLRRCEQQQQNASTGSALQMRLLWKTISTSTWL